MEDAVREVQPPPRLAAAVEALGTGMRGGGGSRRNGVTAESRQVMGESAGRSVSASRAGTRVGPESGAAWPPRRRRQAPGGHAGCPKHTETGLGEGKIRESPRKAGIKRGFGLDSAQQHRVCLNFSPLRRMVQLGWRDFWSRRSITLNAPATSGMYRRGGL